MNPMRTGVLMIAIVAAALACGANAQTKKAPETDQDLRVKASMIKPNTFCLQLGRTIRKSDTSQRGQRWEQAMLQRAKADFNFEDGDIGYVREKRLRVGMWWCTALAAIGDPDHSTRTVSASGERHQLVYTSPRRYVYIDNNRVSAWQD